MKLAFGRSSGKHAKLTSALRSFLAATVATVAVVANLTFIAAPAQALTVDASAASFNFAYPTNGTLMSGASNTVDGAVVKFSNVTGTSVPGVTIDAVVTTTLSNSTITNYDNIGNASSNTDYFQLNMDVGAAYGITTAKFDFYEGGTYTGVGTGIPVVLKNVSVTSIDIDGSTNFCQFTDFTGFQSYVLATDTSLSVKTHATDATIPDGTTRFFAGSCQNNSNRIQDAVQVKFDSVTSFSAKFGTDRSSTPNYFGIAFKPFTPMFGSAGAAPVTNPSNQPPTSSDTSRYVTLNAASVLQLADFGNYSDPDSNPFTQVQITSLPASGTLEKFVNGSWVAVAANDVITVADITNGNLRFTGGVDTSLQFKVHDGTTYSNSVYTLTLLMADQPQTITFNNPGTKTPTTPKFASGATATSGLTVILTSLTPGVCTVSGTDITPVASGMCTIVATQLGNRSWSAAAPVTQTFPISTLTPQTITAPNPGNKTFSGTSFTVTTTPTASSNLTVSMISLTPSVCTVSGFVITIIGTGNCTIRHNQAGNGTYAPAPQVEYTFVVSSPVVDYTLTYDGNNKTGGTVPSSYTGHGSTTLATNSGTLVRSGYTFNGWNTAADGSGTHYAVNASYNLTADVTLYAEWTAINYTITYDGNNKTGGTAPSSYTGHGSTTLATNSGNLVRTGYTFAGWNTAANGSGTHYDVSASYALSADVILYAQWTALSYTITYDANGHTGGSAPSSTTGYGSVTLATNTGSLARTGYTFNGWNTAANGSGTHYAVGGSYNLTADVTLFAEWTSIVYTITYDGNNKTGGSVPSSTTGFGSVTLETNIGNLTKSHNNFTGWNTLANGSGTHYDTGATYSLTANVTLYAEWTPILYTLTYDANGATGGTAPGLVSGNGTKKLAGNTGSLTIANYTFKGWNTSADGSGTHYATGANYELYADVTLYAEWELTPIITYDPNGATGGSTPGSVAQGSPVTIDPNTGALKRAGFKFAGWNTSPDGKGTTYAPGETPNLPVGTVLYAVWIPVSSLAETGSSYLGLLGTSALLIVLGMAGVIADLRIRRRRTYLY